MEQVKEKIKFYVEWLRATLVTTLADATGTISILQNLNNDPIKQTCFLLGIFSIFGLIIVLITLSFRIISEIKKL